MSRSLLVQGTFVSIILFQTLLLLKHLNFSVSSVRVHLAAISTHELPVDGDTVFSRLTVVKFLKGLIKVFPLMKEPVSAWDLSVFILVK